MQELAYSDIKVGADASFAKTITEGDVVQYAGLTGDFNPIHIDAEYARQSMFKERVAHGMLVSGLISAVIGEQLQGHGTVYLGQTLKFRAPVRPGDRVEARVVVREIDHSRRRVTLDCACRVGDRVVLEGEALVLAPSRKFD